MKISARDIDHLSVNHTDPETAAAKLQQLGFNLTPESVEPRCVCFQPDSDDIPNYIELLPGDTQRVALAMNVEELEGEERTHAWETEDGFEVDVGVVIGETGGPLPWFAVKNETPDGFMEPEWIVHPNGALGMMAIHAVAENPRETAKALKVAWGGKTEEIFDGCMMVKAGSVELLIWSPLAYQLEYKALEVMAPQNLPVIVGAAIAIERSRPLQALLRANNVPFALTEGDRVLIAPEQSGGLMLEFMPQT
jgi:hypothetical protein